VFFPHQFALPLPFTTQPTMSSYASSPLSSYATPPEGVASVPSFSLSMGTRTSGEEEFPPMLGVDDFAIVNPDFWDMDETRNDRSLYHGWMGFAEVSVCFFDMRV
jgi:hypothetical protein